MKRIKLLLFVLIIAVPITFNSCGMTYGANNDIHAEETYEIKVIDSCEYIYVSRRPLAGDFSLTHKGNCKYCTERAKRELNN